MTDQPADTSNTQKGISGWLNATGNLAGLVAEEQRPQLIVLILTLIFSQLLIFASNLSDGIKIFLCFSSFVGFLWLAFFILPKQARLVQSVQGQLDDARIENDSLKTIQTELESQISTAEQSLSNTIGKAYSYLETISDKLTSVQEETQDKDTKQKLIDIYHYVDVKKREFDSAVARVNSGSRMIETKSAAAADLNARFIARQRQKSEASKHLS